MLILTRRRGERLIIGDDIIITMLGAVNGQVKIGIDAPANTIVDREEVSIKRRAEKEAIIRNYEEMNELAGDTKGE